VKSKDRWKPERKPLVVAILVLLVFLACDNRIERLTRNLSASDALTREKAADSLGALRDKRAADPLIQLLEDDSSGVRLAAAKALGGIADSSAIEPLIVVSIKDKDDAVRKEAVKALSSFKDGRTFRTLVAKLKDTSLAVRLAAIRALGELRDKEAISPLIDGLGDVIGSSDSVWDATSYALGRMRPESVWQLIDSLENGRLWNQAGIADVLGVLGDSTAIEPLFGAMRRARGSAYCNRLFPSLAVFHDEVSAALGKFSAVVLSRLVAALHDSDFQIRGRAAYALGKTGDTAAIEALIGAFRDSCDYVRSRIAYALGELKDRRTVDALCGELTREQPVSLPFVEITIHSYDSPSKAAEALGKIGDGRAIRSLVRVLRSDDLVLRVAAIRALGEIGGSEAIVGLVSALSDWWAGDCAANGLDKLGWKPESAADSVHWSVARLKDEVDAAKGLWDFFAASESLSLVSTDGKRVSMSGTEYASKHATDRTKLPEEALQYASCLEQMWEKAREVLIEDLHSDRILVVENAAYALISTGKDDTVRELIDALERYKGHSWESRKIAEAYLNSGNTMLHRGATAWAHSHGYTIHKTEDVATMTWGCWRD